MIRRNKRTDFAIFISFSKNKNGRNRINSSAISITILISHINNWEFPLEELTSQDLLLDGGTKIQISDINPGIIDIWNSDDKIDDFSNRMIKAIQQSYSFIIQKGFEIKINNTKIDPLPIELLMTEESTGTGIKPFIYKQTFDDVNVSLAVGFYAPPPSPEDIDDENSLRRSSSDAGWTVVCNDRVVLYNDKSHLTGWGEGGVPIDEVV